MWKNGSRLTEILRIINVYGTARVQSTNQPTNKPTNHPTKGLTKGKDLRAVDVTRSVQPFLRLTASLGSVTDPVTTTGDCADANGFPSYLNTTTGHTKHFSCYYVVRVRFWYPLIYRSTKRSQYPSLNFSFAIGSCLSKQRIKPTFEADKLR